MITSHNDFKYFIYKYPEIESKINQCKSIPESYEDILTLIGMSKPPSYELLIDSANKIEKKIIEIYGER